MTFNPAILPDYLLPPKAKTLLRGLLSPLIGFTKASSWEDAVRKSVGYEDLDVVQSAVQTQVVRTAIHEVDSRTMQIATAIVATRLDTRPLKVLDIGGADGHYYREMEQLFGSGTFDWTVLETEPMTARFAGQATSSLRWASEPGSLNGRFDVVLLSSVLQYVADPYSLLRTATRLGEAVVINRLPVIDGSNDIPTVQHLRMYGRRGSYPAWFFSRERIDSVLAELGETVLIWKVPEDKHVLRFREVRSIGMIIRPH